MRYVSPIPITSALLRSSSLTEDLPRSAVVTYYNVWSSTTTYAVGNTICIAAASASPGLFDGDSNLFAVLRCKVAHTNVKPYLDEFGELSSYNGWAWELIRTATKWLTDVAYPLGQVVGHISGATGAFYEGLIADNIGNTPSSSPTQWKGTGTAYNTWSGATTYGLNELVCTVTGPAGGQSTRGRVFRSLQAGNLNHAPETSSSWWIELGEGFKEYDEGVSYGLADIVLNSKEHRIYESLVASNLGNSLADETKWLLLGPSNRYAMFDVENSTESTALEVIEFTVAPATTYDTLAMINLRATRIWLVGRRPSAQRNRFTWSEQLDNAAWTKTRCSVSVNFANARTGAATMDKLIEDTSNNTHLLQRADTEVIASASDPRCLIFDVRADERTKIRAAMVGSASGCFADFDLVAQTAAPGVISGGTAPLSATIVDRGDGVFSCSLISNFAAGNIGAVVTAKLTLLNDAGLETYLGDGTSGLSLWGVSIETDDAVNAYQSVEATYTGKEICYSQFINTTDTSFINNWRNYYFDPLRFKGGVVLGNLPFYSDMELSVTTRYPGSMVRIGQVLIGAATELGETLLGAGSKIRDYSLKETDAFGTTTFVERGFAKTAQFQVKVSESNRNAVESLLEDVRATPGLWVGNDKYVGAVVFGIARDFEIKASDHLYHILDLDLEGLAQ